MGRTEEVISAVQRAYLGFVVVRPLPSVPIGRTILKHLPPESARKFTAVVSYKVHLFGLELTITGLAFQQQDRAVAACATTAIWTALQRLCRFEGARVPTPAAITEAAVRHYVPEGRPVPSPGLTIEQVCEALRTFEFAPDVFQVANDPLRFLLLLNIYVKSGVPVILALRGEDFLHAVTVCGYREAPEPFPPLVFDNLKVRLLNLDYDQLYIHDDRLGPYARAKLILSKANKTNRRGQDLLLQMEWPDGKTESLSVAFGAAPLYPKLRTNALAGC